MMFRSSIQSCVLSLNWQDTIPGVWHSKLRNIAFYIGAFIVWGNIFLTSAFAMQSEYWAQDGRGRQYCLRVPIRAQQHIVNGHIRNEEACRQRLIEENTHRHRHTEITGVRNIEMMNSVIAEAWHAVCRHNPPHGTQSCPITIRQDLVVHHAACAAYHVNPTGAARPLALMPIDTIACDTEEVCMCITQTNGVGTEFELKTFYPKIKDLRK